MPHPFSETVKKACPNAIIQVFILNKDSHLGVKIYLTPSMAPGSVKDLIARIINIINNPGITILLSFSIPFDIPKDTIIKVRIRDTKSQGIELLVPAKESKKISGLIVLISPVKLIVKYFNIQPITTE